MSYLTIGYWNINGINNKIDDTIVQTVNNFDIYCFAETWLKEPDYIVNMFNDKYVYCKDALKLTNTKNGRNSGGLALIIKKNIRKGVKIIDNTTKIGIWIKLDRTFFGLDEDQYVFAVYIPPKCSPYHIIDVFTTI
jgi:exonuclease III